MEIKKLRIPNFKGKNVFLMRLITGNFAVILVGVIFLAAISIYNTMHIISTNSKSSAVEQTNYVSNMSDDFINEIYKVSCSLSIANYSGLAYTQWTKQHKYDLDFREWLINFQTYINSYEYINNIWIYCNDIIIDSKNGISATSDFEHWRFISETHNRAKIDYIESIPYVSQVHYVNYTPVISFAMPLSIQDYNFNYGIIIINIKLEDIKSRIGYGTYTHNNTTLIYNKDTNSILTSTDDNFDSLNASAIITEYLHDKSKNTYVNGKVHYTIYSRPSSIVSNWEYITLYDTGLIRKAKINIVSWYCAIISIVIAICLISNLFISLYIYKPMRQVVKNLTNFTTNKNIDDVSLISSSINQLQSELSIKSKFISDNISKIRYMAVLNLLQRDTNKSEAKNDLYNCNVIFTEKNFYLASFTIDNYLNLLDSCSDSKLSSTLNKIHDIIYKTLIQSLNTIGINMNNKFIFILNIDQPLSANVINELLNKINNSLNETINLSMSLCISHSVPKLEDIHSAYEQILSQEQNRFTKGNKSLIICPYINNFVKPDFNSISKEINNLIYYISKKDFIQIVKQVEKITNELKGSDFETLQKNINLMLDAIEKNSMLNIQNFNFNEIYHQLSQIYSYGNFDEMISFLNQTFTNISINYSGVNNQSLSKKLKDYIDQHYYEDLSLDYLADKFKLSASYISKIFIETYQIGFQNYLTNVRIEKAKILLKTNDLSIQTISKKVGFLNYNSFSRAFRRITGQSAKSYKLNTLK